MRVALYQCEPLPLDVSGNLTRLERQAQAAAAQGAQLLVCPEMFLTGYNIGARACAELAQAQDGPAAQRIAEIARQYAIAILYGYPERSVEQQIYNAVQLIDSRGERSSNYRKTHLFSELDKSMFSAGEDLCPVVELNGWRLGMLICYDVEFPENTRRLALAGAELILVPTANMAPFDFVCDVTVRARAFENHCYVVYANYCGSEGEIRYCGLSSVCAPDGSRPALAAQDERLLIADLDRVQLAQARTVNDYFKDRRPDVYSPR
ncbi:carbon-nitrogen hydrolase family protein [Pseudomonas alliivorans]|uniref:carbon-nitrogen hydrolase family protein n=1 Tax=Pseudomonas alliivorans TaxID=2810613 RepID=UPI001AE1D543|nr:carbon-nitrogen hydrolase family protein [Pseudomonas alliivorans]MBP0953250.1 carbon-nitrogen hydrolase family protein [Pseudomonas alliivorans]MCO5364242.1 carbon-nitrogen hydrolase family protein [Pseudomonas alliivorans]MEE4575623.1 carbon-nitrogen hydrolase family protein [Pseudomonas alliivorans]MEE4892001.1 carbon-nitrogen hydrolase family protein [Pseudomonas alliivorans]MEE5040389.1 carbon-nitrogen hydrolase family protein [Pseudomonas alliivorans]